MPNWNEIIAIGKLHDGFHCSAEHLASILLLIPFKINLSRQERTCCAISHERERILMVPHYLWLSLILYILLRKSYGMGICFWGGGISSKRFLTMGVSLFFSPFSLASPPPFLGKEEVCRLKVMPGICATPMIKISSVGNFHFKKKPPSQASHLSQGGGKIKGNKTLPLFGGGGWGPGLYRSCPP